METKGCTKSLGTLVRLHSTPVCYVRKIGRGGVALIRVLESMIGTPICPYPKRVQNCLVSNSRKLSYKTKKKKDGPIFLSNTDPVGIEIQNPTICDLGGSEEICQ